jgi:hypothetical protein
MEAARALLPLGLLLAAIPALAQDKPVVDPPLGPTPNLEQAMMLRCSAAFALVSGDQARGDKLALGYPPLGQRGREFFVRASAQLMDEMHVSHDQVEAMLREQVAELQQGSTAAKDRAAYVDAVMQPCLEELVANGF